MRKVNDINVLVPVVGRGIRVQEKYNCPKPLIKINNKTIIEHCIESLNINGNYIFVIRKFKEYGNKEEEYTTQLKTILINLKSDCKIIEIDYVTEGPACSVLLAKNYINNDIPLIITNCDQRTEWNSPHFLNFLQEANCDGCVSTYPHQESYELNKPSPYSFVKLNEEGYAIQFEEKFSISQYSLNGLHYWKQGKDFVAAAEQMIQNNDRCKNEFYISKSYNYLIQQNKKIIIYPMKKDEFFALGSTEEIGKYLRENKNEKI